MESATSCILDNTWILPCAYTAISQSKDPSGKQNAHLTQPQGDMRQYKNAYSVPIRWEMNLAWDAAKTVMKIRPNNFQNVL